MSANDSVLVLQNLVETFEFDERRWYNANIQEFMTGAMHNNALGEITKELMRMFSSNLHKKAIQFFAKLTYHGTLSHWEMMRDLFKHICETKSISTVRWVMDKSRISSAFAEGFVVLVKTGHMSVVVETFSRKPGSMHVCLHDTAEELIKNDMPECLDLVLASNNVATRYIDDLVICSIEFRSVGSLVILVNNGPFTFANISTKCNVWSIISKRIDKCLTLFNTVLSAEFHTMCRAMCLSRHAEYFKTVYMPGKLNEYFMLCHEIINYCSLDSFTTMLILHDLHMKRDPSSPQSAEIKEASKIIIRKFGATNDLLEFAAAFTISEVYVPISTFIEAADSVRHKLKFRHFLKPYNNCISHGDFNAIVKAGCTDYEYLRDVEIELGSYTFTYKWMNKFHRFHNKEQTKELLRMTVNDGALVKTHPLMVGFMALNRIDCLCSELGVLQIIKDFVVPRIG